MKKYIVSSKENGLKLDKYIGIKVNANKTFILMMLRKKQIKINGVHPKDTNTILKESDEIIFYLDETCFKKEEEIKPKFDIIYEDQNILIIDKDKHIPVYSDNHHDLVSLVNNYLSKKQERNAAPVNRLDENTEGLIIFSKNSESTKIIQKMIESKSIEKHYLALVKGVMEKEEDTLRNYYVYDDKLMKAKVFDKNIGDSKEIITGYKVIETKNNMSLLSVQLLTGRTHQIRCHMAYINHPIIGDNKYGDKILNNRLNKKSQELISYKLVFPKDNLLNLDYLKNKVFISKKRIEF